VQGKLKVLGTEWKGLDDVSKAMVAKLTGKGAGKHVVNLE
jgi:NADPH-dependent curcumin reductase CurA